MMAITGKIIIGEKMLVSSSRSMPHFFISPFALNIMDGFVKMSVTTMRMYRMIAMTKRNIVLFKVNIKK
jgi:hypothetical protein